nr:uncharacterized protein LOC107450719 [Parasteatoda tepidariorum]
MSVFRIDNYGGMFNDKKTTFVFKDKHQNSQIKKLDHVHSQEKTATLNIKFKGSKNVDKDLQLQFHIGSKKKKVKNVHKFYYGNHSQDDGKDAFLIEPGLEMGYGEPLTYHIFMYFKNNAPGEEPNIKADNDVNKALKEIIKSSDPVKADGSFRWERTEKAIRNVRNSLCDFLKAWIKPSSSTKNKVNIDFYRAVQYVLTNPNSIFTHTPGKEDLFGLELGNFDFSPDKFMTNAHSNSSGLMQKLFKKHFTDFRKNTFEKIDKDGESDDLEFLNRINLKFKEAMKKNFKEYRDEKNIQSDFHEKAYHMDAIIHQVQRTANETDANDALDLTFHIDRESSYCTKGCKKFTPRRLNDKHHGKE